VTGARSILAAALLLLANAAGASNVDIVVASSDDASYPWVRHIEETYIPAVEAALEGSNITVHWKTNLGDGTVGTGDELHTLANGAAQIAPIPALPHSWALYLHNISIATPFVCSRPDAIGAAIDHLNDSFPSLPRAWASFDLIYLGGSFGHDPFVIVSTEPVSGIEDLARKTVAADYLFLDWFAGTRMLGLPGDSDTFRNGFESGITDAAIMTASMADRLQIEDVAPFVTDPGLGSVWGGGLAADREWYTAQRAALRHALRTGAKAYGEALAAEMSLLAAVSLENLTLRGALVSSFSEEEQQLWADAMRDVASEWAYEIDIRNMPGRSLLSVWMEDLAATCGAPVRDWKAPVLGE
jgi:TRAP-type C4-dicarboxylate transport system substrate-binding protein